VSERPSSGKLVSAEQLTELIETERAQIGSEIHDGLLPLIFAASAATGGVLQELADDDPLRPRLQQIADWLTESMTTGRQLLWHVYPPELSGIPWTKAARDSLERSLAGQPTSMRWDLYDKLASATPTLSLTAYRIVVEAVRNASTNGKASEVWIRGTAQDNQWVIVIRDNGSGFDPDSIADDRYGIRSMKARAKLVGGNLEIKSQAGDGTTVTARLPSK